VTALPDRRAAACCLWSAAALLACSSCYTGSARTVSSADIGAGEGWTLVRGVPFVHQRSQRDCGAAVLAMVLRYWGVPVAAQEVIAAYPQLAERGLRAGELRDFARRRGLHAYLIEAEPADLVTELERGRPLIVGLAKPYGREAVAHYEVVVGLHRARRRVLTLDPARGFRENTVEGFASEWAPTRKLAVVIFRPAPAPAGS
jgi:ABC-type bacteriocin/lantibiotic exporter with double-glycine peptidase domain